MRPLLSVVIATKNREKYCIAAIDSILNYKDDRVEITVADNSSTTKVKDYISELNSSFIKYIYNPAEISSIDNFNAAMELATGEYVILIGDDDSILPTAITTAEWAKNNNVDSICSKETVAYYWPNAVASHPDGFMSFSTYSGKIKQINLDKELDKLIKNGLQHYLLFNLPKTYHGLVKKEIMNEIKKLTGSFYGGLSPDIYSCIAVSCLAKNHFNIDQPLSIAGVCATSTTADNFTGKHSGEIEGIPHLRYRGVYNWSSLIPKFYSVNTIWAESGIKALEDLKRTDLIKKFNIYKLLVQSEINNKKYIASIIEREKKITKERLAVSNFTFNLNMFKVYMKTYYDKGINILKSTLFSKTKFEFGNVQDISEAILKSRI